MKRVSLRDRDDNPLNTVCEKTQRDKSDTHVSTNFLSRTFRRREIENYALVPNCIARTLGVATEDIREWWEEVLGLAWSDGVVPADATTVTEGRFKEELTKRLAEGGKSLEELWEQMVADEIHTDIKSIICQIENL